MVGGTAFHLRARRTEIDEPIPEGRSRHRFERLVHAAVEINIVIERAQDAEDTILLNNRRKPEPNLTCGSYIEVLLNRTDRVGVYMVSCSRIDHVGDIAGADLSPWSHHHNIRAVRSKPIWNYGARAGFPSSHNNNIARFQC